VGEGGKEVLGIHPIELIIQPSLGQKNHPSDG
jgi:hypothetical protein